MAVAVFCGLVGIAFWTSVYLLMTPPEVDPGELNEDEIARALAACGPDESSGSEKPVPALRREPTYPTDALRGGTEGYVLMSFLVGPDGQAVIALYAMERQPDGSWRINGVYLLQVPGAST